VRQHIQELQASFGHKKKLKLNKNKNIFSTERTHINRVYKLSLALRCCGGGGARET
jgi:hypothetical protein